MEYAPPPPPIVEWLRTTTQIDGARHELRVLQRATRFGYPTVFAVEVFEPYNGPPVVEHIRNQNEETPRSARRDFIGRTALGWAQTHLAGAFKPTPGRVYTPEEPRGSAPNPVASRADEQMQLFSSLLSWAYGIATASDKKAVDAFKDEFEVPSLPPSGSAKAVQFAKRWIAEIQDRDRDVVDDYASYIRRSRENVASWFAQHGIKPWSTRTLPAGVARPSVPRTLQQFKREAYEQWLWSVHSHSDANLQRYLLKAHNVTAAEVRGEHFDRRFWLGEMQDALLADARKRLSPAAVAQLEAYVDTIVEAVVGEYADAAELDPERVAENPSGKRNPKKNPAGKVVLSREQLKLAKANVRKHYGLKRAASTGEVLAVYEQFPLAEANRITGVKATVKKNPAPPNAKPSDFDPVQYKRGLAQETKEHGKKLAPRVVMDHLTADPDYYAKKNPADKFYDLEVGDAFTFAGRKTVFVKTRTNEYEGEDGKRHKIAKGSWSMAVEALGKQTIAKKNPASPKPRAGATGMQEWGYVWQLDCIDPQMRPFKIKLGQRRWMMGHDPDGKAWPKNEALIVDYVLTDEHEVTDVPRSMRKYAGRGPIYGGQFMAPSGADWKLLGVAEHIWYERTGTKHPGHWQHPYGEKGEPLPNLYVWTYRGKKFYRLCLGPDAVWNVRGFVTP